MSTSPNTTPPTYAKQVAMLQALANGLNKHGSTLPTIVIQGKSYQAADFITAIQARLAATQAVPPARAAWQNAVKADQAERASIEPLVSGLKHTLLVAYANQVDVLADFGVVPHKRSGPSPATQVAAAQKAKATRAARHTMGSKQKAAIKGDATSSAVTAASPPANGAPAATAAVTTPVVTTAPAQPKPSGS